MNDKWASQNSILHFLRHYMLIAGIYARSTRYRV